MSEKKNEKPVKETNIRLGKETFGTIPIEECFRMALEPYFTEDAEQELYLQSFRKT